MPRLRPSLLIKAFTEYPLLVLLLRECRDLPSARNELRWLNEHAKSISAVKPQASTCLQHHSLRTQMTLQDLCRRRSRGEPLQYLIGNQPFGDLEILCRKNVLIPRPETEAYTYHVADLIKAKYINKTKSAEPLRILDLCTGTGCIPLLLHSLLGPTFRNLQIIGVDISPTALSLAKDNLEHNIELEALDRSSREQVSFIKADVLHSDNAAGACAMLRGHMAIDEPRFDIITSNPPYISRREYGNGTTSRSVRNFEPELALVPQHFPENWNTADPSSRDVDGDVFYGPIMSLAIQMRATMVVLECGSQAQADRIVATKEDMEKDSGLVPEDEFSVDFWGQESGPEGAKAVILTK